MESNEAEALMSDNGIVEKISSYSVQETLDRLTTILLEKGITVFARIDQQMEAERVGLELRPTQLLLFGDPKNGTPLMTNFPSIALDLPLKVVAVESDDGIVRVYFNSPLFFQQRHHLPKAPFEPVEVLINLALS